MILSTEQKCLEENKKNSKICNPDCKIVGEHACTQQSPLMLDYCSFNRLKSGLRIIWDAATGHLLTMTGLSGKHYKL